MSKLKKKSFKPENSKSLQCRIIVDKHPVKQIDKKQAKYFNFEKNCS
jgi:hypothetical protein